MTDLKQQYDACPHDPAHCLSGKPCPFHIEGECRIADNFTRLNSCPTVSAAYWLPVKAWTISAMMKERG